MTHTEFTCSVCGSPNLRRSRRGSALELSRMALGTYPFRCLDCRQRVWINIWLFSKGKSAACPRCLTVEVSPSDPRTMRLGMWRRVLLKFGARGYRCLRCKRGFLSFKRAEDMPSPLAETTTGKVGSEEIAASAAAGK